LNLGTSLASPFTSLATMDGWRISSRKLWTPKQCQYSLSAVPRIGFWRTWNLHRL